MGLYSLPEAAQLIGVPATKLRRWSYGYFYGLPVREKSFSAPLIEREAPDLGDEKIITFLDLIELLFVSLFRREGVSIQVIRAAASNAHHLFGTSHPFAVKRFDTDGKRIFATLEADEAGVSPTRLVQDLRLTQMVMDTVARPFFRNLDYDADEVLRYWPKGKEFGVVIDPRRDFGKPVDDRSGVPTFVLHQMARSGEGIEDIADWYGVDVDTVIRAIQYESSLRAA